MTSKCRDCNETFVVESLWLQHLCDEHQDCGDDD